MKEKNFILEYAKPRFATFVKYGKIELTPPSPAEIPAAFAQASGIVKSAMTFKWTQLTVKVKKAARHLFGFATKILEFSSILILHYLFFLCI